MEIFPRLKSIKLTDPQRARVAELMRFDKDQFIDYDQLLTLMNRAFRETKAGKFHMTVKELQDLFFQQDKDFSGMLDAFEIAQILNQVHMVTDPVQVEKYMEQMDKDGDGQMDFEEFMTLCQLIYKDRGGVVVANRSGPAAFNQTRGIIDKLRDRVERKHLMITHLKSQIANFDEQLEIMDTISAHSALQQEVNKTREETRKLKKLKHEMNLQHRGWMRDIKALHGREKHDMMEKIKFIEQQIYEGRKYGNTAMMKAGDEDKEEEFSLKEAYDEMFFEKFEGNADIAEMLQSLRELADYVDQKRSTVALDTRNTKQFMRMAQDRLGEYKTVEEGDVTVFSTEVYNSAAAIEEFLESRSSALEQWLIKRTQFTQKDREKYMKRVEDVKKQREEYEANRIALTKQLAEVESKIKSVDKKHKEKLEKNNALRKKLDDPTQRKHDEELEEKLTKDLGDIQEAIAKGHEDKLEWSKKLYPMQHKLHLERAKVSLLQVELGELKVLLEDVHHHEDVEKRTV